MAKSNNKKKFNINVEQYLNCVKGRLEDGRCVSIYEEFGENRPVMSETNGEKVPSLLFEFKRPYDKEASNPNLSTFISRIDEENKVVYTVFALTRESAACLYFTLGQMLEKSKTVNTNDASVK